VVSLQGGFKVYTFYQHTNPKPTRI